MAPAEDPEAAARVPTDCLELSSWNGIKVERIPQTGVDRVVRSESRFDRVRGVIPSLRRDGGIPQLGCCDPADECGREAVVVCEFGPHAARIHDSL